MSIINMSIIAIPLIAVITLIRFFTVYKLPKKTFYVMWGIALYQLLIPYNLFARFDISAYITVLSEKVKELFIKAPEIIDVAATVENPINIADTSNIIIDDISHSMFYNLLNTFDRFSKEMFDRIDIINTTGADSMTKTVENTANQFSLNISPLLLIWIAGFLCFAAYFIIINIKTRRIYEQALPIDNTFVRAWRVKYSDSTRRKVKIKQSDLIRSPLTYGIFRPVILLPESTDYNDKNTLEYILLHEYTHIWRFDVFAKLLLITALCVHWFNPLVWLMYILANRDIELSCDEAVVRKSNINNSVNLKSDYALALLALEEKKNLLALGVHFSRNIMKERIKSIMKIPEKSKSRIIAAVILISMITVMFAALQSCENNIEPKVEIIEITNVQGEVIETREIIVPPEPFEMPEQTDKLVLYTYSMNKFMITPAVNIFKEKYPDVEVEVVNYSDQEYENILPTELGAGKGPDLVLSFTGDLGGNIYKMMATEIFVDLNQFIVRDNEFSLDDYVKGVLDSGVYRGKRYLMPIEYGVPILTTTQEILDEEKIIPADFNTFDGFMKTAEKYNEKYKDNPEKSVLVDFKHNRANLAFFLKYSGIELIDYQANAVGIDKTNFKNIMDLMKAMYNKETNDSISISGVYGEGLKNQDMLFNNFFMTTGYFLFMERTGLLNKNLTPLLFTYPNVNNGVTAEVINVAAIPKGSTNQLNAYNFLKILLSEDIQAGNSGGNYLKLGNPVLKSSVNLKIKQDYKDFGSIDENTVNAYAKIIMNVDSAILGIPNALQFFIIDEMTPYWEGTRSFDDCYARLVNKLEIYKDE